MQQLFVIVVNMHLWISKDKQYGNFEYGVEGDQVCGGVA